MAGKQRRNGKRPFPMILRRLFINRKVKDRLFRAVFKEKKYQLQLYNAINDTNYQNEDDLIVYTLEDVIYLKMKNDLSFIIVGSTLNLYEHQSTFNPNMQLRAVLYFARQYEIFVEENNLDVYSEKLIKIPMPQMIVFYNGEKEMPEEMELKLSDAYMRAEGRKPAMECFVRVININFGHNQTLMKKCSRLEEYSRFIQILSECKENEPDIRKATYMAVERGIEEGLLPDILIRQKTEVCAMVLTEYNEKRHMRSLYQNGYDSGYDGGYDQGTAETRRQTIISMLNNGLSPELIREYTGYEREVIAQVSSEFYRNK